MVTPVLKSELVDWSIWNPPTLVALSVQLRLIWLAEEAAADQTGGSRRKRRDIGKPDVVHAHARLHSAVIDQLDI